VTIGLILVVLGTLLGAYDSAARSEAFVQDRAATLDEMRVTMDRVTRDARQASAVLAGSGPDRLAVETYVLGAPTTVVFAVSGDTLTRQVGNESPSVMQRHLASSAVFSYAPSVDSAQVVTVTLAVRPPARPQNVVTISSEVSFRNEGAA